MTAQPVDTPLEAVPDPPVPRIQSNPDGGGVLPFDLAYEGPDGKEVVERLHYRKVPPFSVYARYDDVRIAAARKIPPEMTLTAIRLFRAAMPIGDANRLVTLVEGDADEVGTVTAVAIGEVIELIRANAYDAPKPIPRSPASSNGPRSTGRSSSPKKSSRASKSTTSRRKKA